MIHLLIILGIVVFLMRAFFRLMYPRLPEQAGPKVQQILSCDYCGRLVAEDQGVQRRGRFFCGGEHASRYFQ